MTPGPAPPRAAAGQAATPADAVVLDLGDIRITDTPRVGPKLARLGQLASAGWRVPDGYAVTVQTLGSWLPPAAKSEIERLITGTAGTAVATTIIKTGDRVRVDGRAGTVRVLA